MNGIRSHRLIFVFIAAIILVHGFIFYNSFQDGETSNEQSGKIEEVVEPVIDAVVGEDHGWNVKWLVRKSAHIIEFATLGFLFSVLAFLVGKCWGRNILPYGFFYLLATAVTDEYIQSFTGRTSTVSDVLIDFAGAMLGMLIGFFVCRIIRNWKRRCEACR